MLGRIEKFLILLKNMEQVNKKNISIVLEHPGKTSYHDNSFWVAIRGLKEGVGVWLMPGEKLAIIKKNSKISYENF